MDHRLIQQQSQKLILSPQIRQYLRLLQLPLLDLQQAVEVEMGTNPLLEEKAAADINEETSSQETPVTDIQEAASHTAELKPGESFEAFDRLDESYLDTYDSLDTARGDIKNMESQRQFQETLLTRPEALSDFLTWQARFLDFSEDEKPVVQEIIGNIDEDGYLRITTDELAKTCQTDAAKVEHLLSRIQELDPPGIGARNLQEALTLQIKKKIAEVQSRPQENEKDQNLPVLELALEIVTSHLPILEKRDWNALARLLQKDFAEIKKAAELIGRLDPRPGRSFYTEESLTVIPDTSITIDEDNPGKYKIEIHDERVPQIRISPYYRRLLRGKDLDEKSRVFLKEKLQAAMTFLQAMKLRKSTLREITEEIIQAQGEFLEKGFAHLKPLRLKDISSKLGIHESTVSRAAQGKYVSTPQGLIPYKSFFSTAMESSDGTAESQKSIMEKVRSLVDKESPEKPLSDQDIMEIIQKEGVVIARRTVAKYRDLLKILPSHLRRKK